MNKTFRYNTYSNVLVHFIVRLRVLCWLFFGHNDMEFRGFRIMLLFSEMEEFMTDFGKWMRKRSVHPENTLNIAGILLLDL